MEDSSERRRDTTVGNKGTRKVIILKGIRAYFGLMFRNFGEEIYVLDIGKEKEIEIHTFFCLKSMDIVLLDNSLRVVGFYKNVRPFSIIFPKTKFRYVIEGKNITEEDIKYISNCLAAEK